MCVYVCHEKPQSIHVYATSGLAMNRLLFGSWQNVGLNRLGDTSSKNQHSNLDDMAAS